jgi:para-nitrobenzyl esterase
MRIIDFALAGLISIAALPVAAHDRDRDAGLRRDTRFGPIIGAVDRDVQTWKGVPFARPPVGELRWRAPVDPRPWKRPRLAREFGNACASNGRIFGPGANNRYDQTIATTYGTPVGSEDCLYLNIWRPAHGHNENLPVIFFVHGGSNITGYTADPVYDGAELARTARAVVVTANYRLGIFGFLNQPALKTGDALQDSGNFALLDIIKALQFVHRNIREFGGDPHNVTLMGQSAGAVNVYAVLTSPLVTNAHHKLVHRAVPISGGLSLAHELPPGALVTLAPASFFLFQGNTLLQQQLIADGLAADAASAAAYVASHTTEQMAAYLRGKSAAALLGTVLTRLVPMGLGGSGPIPDGAVLPLDPVAEIQAGRYLRVPILAGNTREECKLFPSLLALAPALGGTDARIPNDPQVFNIQFNYRPDDPPQIAITDWLKASFLPVTAPVTGYNARTDLLNRFFFIPSRDSILSALASQQNEIWYYQFDWAQEPYPFNEIYGAAHAFDLPFLFGNFGPSLFSNVVNSAANRRGRLDLSEAMMHSLAAFARHGDPNHRALGVSWPAWPATLHFDATPARKVITVTP